MVSLNKEPENCVLVRLIGQCTKHFSPRNAPFRGDSGCHGAGRQWSGPLFVLTPWRDGYLPSMRVHPSLAFISSSNVHRQLYNRPVRHLSSTPFIPHAYGITGDPALFNIETQIMILWPIFRKIAACVWQRIGGMRWSRHCSTLVKWAMVQ